MGLWVYLGLYFTEKYPKVPCQLLVKLALVKDNDWLGLDEAIIIAGEEVPYQSMSIPLVSQTSLRMRNPLPFTKEYISPFSSVSQSPSQVSSLGNYSPLSLPTLSDVLCPFTPIEDDPEGDVVYMGKHDAAPNSSQVDFKPDICFFIFAPCFWIILKQHLFWRWFFIHHFARCMWHKVFQSKYKYGR